jgi:hypothetical protein
MLNRGGAVLSHERGTKAQSYRERSGKMRLGYLYRKLNWHIGGGLGGESGFPTDRKSEVAAHDTTVGSTPSGIDRT